MSKIISCGAAVLLSALAFPVLADEVFPSKPIRLVVAFPPGGAVDSIARVFGEGLAARLKQPVIIDNRPGAGTTIGADFVARAAPDGYTLYVGGVSVMGGDNALYKSLRYSPADFRPITQLSASPMLLVTGKDSKIGSVAALLDLAKKEPGNLSFSSSGSGAPTHLAGALFDQVANVKINHIPYKGGSQSATAVAAGDVEVSFATPASVIPLIDGGKLRPLAVTSAARVAGFPKVPTVKESGVPNYQFSTWWGLYAPAKTPDAVVKSLFEASVEVLKMDSIRKQLLARGEEAAPSASLESFKAFAEQEGKFIIELIKYSGAQAD